jgi:hypothetical protein
MYGFIAYLNYINVKVVIILSFWDTFMFGGRDGDPNNNGEKDQDRDHDKKHDNDHDPKSQQRKTRKKSRK